MMWWSTMTKDPQLEPEGRRLVTSAPARDVPVVSRVVLGISTLLALCLGCRGMLLSCHAGYSIKRRNRLFIVLVLSFVSTIASTRQVTNQLLIEPLSFGFKRRERSFSHIVCDSLVKMSCCSYESSCNHRNTTISN